MSGAHSHDHGPAATRQIASQRLLWVLALTGSYMVAELIGAWISNSLALLADAGHMLADTAALALAWFASWAARRPAGRASTFGYHRAEILAALINGTALMVIALFVFLEALQRVRQPPEVEGGVLLAIACGGLVMNVIGLRLLAPGRDSINLQGAWLHLISDALGSIGAIFSGVLIVWRGWTWADPLASIVIAIFIVHAAWSLLKETVAVLMESAPGHIDVDEVRSAIATVNGVLEVHDLHVWTITSGMESLSAHVVMAAQAASDAVLADVRTLLAHRFGIRHVTIQVEAAAQPPCGDCS